MNGMLTNAYMVDKTVANAADRMDDEETQEVPIMAQTKKKKNTAPASHQGRMQQWQPLTDALHRAVEGRLPKTRCEGEMGKHQAVLMK